MIESFSILKDGNRASRTFKPFCERQKPKGWNGAREINFVNGRRFLTIKLNWFIKYVIPDGFFHIHAFFFC